jgi:hypothetical protein
MAGDARGKHSRQRCRGVRTTWRRRHGWLKAPKVRTIRPRPHTEEPAMTAASLRNQQRIITNQKTIVRNQTKILRGLQAMLKNQKKILANQSRILAK